MSTTQRPSKLRSFLSPANLWKNPWTLMALLLVSSAGAAVYAYARDDQRLLVLGRTSDGHRLMEGACASCHVPWAQPASTRCSECHAGELARDHHPAAKFANIARWSDLVDSFDVRDCTTCHREHRKAEMGFTAEGTLCSRCHADLTVESRTHKGFSGRECLDCHNYHEESAIEYGAAVTHLRDADTKAPEGWLHPSPRRLPAPGSDRIAPDAPARVLAESPASVEEWRASAHAPAGVNCSACHTRKSDGLWVARPSEAVCDACHKPEVETYHQGKHGMRAGTVGTPLAVRDPDVKLPMRKDAPEAQGCNACHGTHTLDLGRAQIAACIGCHDDEHTRNYLASPHGRALAAGRTDAPTCASCHLPGRLVSTDNEEGDEGAEDEEGAEPGKPARRVTVHNNSLTMRPSERMLGEVCTKCHGLAFAWSSLRSANQIRTNFAGRPPVDPMVAEYMRMVAETQKRRSEKRTQP